MYQHQQEHSDNKPMGMSAKPGLLVNKLGHQAQLFSPQVQKVLNSVTKEVPEKDREWLEKTLRELNLG